MRLLVVGASGFLGRNIVHFASSLGWEVQGTYWRSRGFRSWARSNGCRPVRCNLLGPRRKWSADACIFVAGTSDHMASIRDPVGDLRNNVERLVHFLDGFRGGVVLISSAAVYEGQRNLVSPQTSVRPSLPYGVSKFAAERYLAFHAQKGRIEWATTLRLYYAYGPHDSDGRFVPRLVQAARSGARQFVITASPGSLIDPLYAEDVARASVFAAFGRHAGSIFDLCGGRPRTIPRFVTEALRSQGWRMTLVVRPKHDETPLRFFSRPDEVRRALQLPPFIPFQEGLSRYISWRWGS